MPAFALAAFIAFGVYLFVTSDTSTSSDNPESPDSNDGDSADKLGDAVIPNSTLVFHAERCPDNAPLQAFIDWWKENGPFPIVITSGLRTQEQQAALYSQGRTAPGKIVTNASNASTSPHGRGAAIDCMPVRDSVGSYVKTIYTGNESDDDTLSDGTKARDVANERIATYVSLVKEHGLTSGADFPGLHDTPHAEDPNWQQLPFPPVS
jgi:hypothetical protein